MHSVVISQGKKNRKRNFLSQTNLLRRGLHLALEKLKQPKAGFQAFMLSADTGLHGSERIASMLTWNDFGWDIKMRPWETAKFHHKLPESSQIEGNQQGSDQIGLVRLSLREKSLSLDEISFLVSSSGTCVFSGLTITGAHESESSQQSYRRLAEQLRLFGSDPVKDSKELWRRVLFNILCNNTDDHLRNHGFLWDGKGWRLSPAYDRAFMVFLLLVVVCFSRSILGRFPALHQFAGFA